MVSCWLSVYQFVHLSVIHLPIFLFTDNHLNKCKWIFTKLDMCIANDKKKKKKKKKKKCAIGITCINIDPVFCFASLLLRLGTAGPVDAGPCLCLFSLHGSAAWLGLYYVTFWYLGILANSLITGQPARLRSLILLFCWPVILPPGGLLCLDLWYFIRYAAVR